MSKKLVVALAVAAALIAAYLLLSPAGQAPAARPGGAPPAPLVRTAPAREESFTDSIEALGTIRADEAVEITANVSAKVIAVHFNDNQRVDAGALLVELDGASAAARLREAEVVARDDQRLLDHYQALDRTAAVSKTLLAEQRAKAEASAARVAEARAELEDFTIRAPLAGVLGTRRVSPGSLVSPGTPVTTLDAIAALRVDFTVPERWLSQLAPGQAVRASSVAYPGRVFEGRVASIGSRIDPVTRAVPVIAALDNSDRLLRPGMLLDIALLGEPRPVRVVSEQALMREGPALFVYVVDGDGRVERRAVAIGQRRPGLVEIVEGLELGERVIIEGAQKVREGTVVRMADDGVS